MSSMADRRRLVREVLKHPAITKSIKGFSLAYIYVQLPRVLSILSRLARRKHSVKDAFERLQKSLKRGLLPNRFPFFALKLIFGVYFLDTILTRSSTFKGNKPLSLFTSAFISGFYNVSHYKYGLQSHPNGPDTSDMTLFLLVRMVDMLVRMGADKLRIPRRVMEFGDVALFTGSCFAIMFAWFYYPHSLPVSYRKWITMAANMDDELVETLRLIRNGEIIYGKESKHDDLLHDMCIKYGMDPEVGKFSKTAPLPCRLVHSNVTDSCEVHALWRFYRGFYTALSIYLPINVLMSLISRSWKKAWMQVILGSARSSVFLATFITLNWYSVCLFRSRIGPKLFPEWSAQQLEDTYGPGLGSLTCGLSSLVEFPKRRGELALFVAPRALATFLPSIDQYKDSRRAFRIECLVFALSFAGLVTGTRFSGPENIRGVFKKLISSVF